ncbi:hypothetical protein SMKI_06G1110 [Saccharomyces mikatae IFO 1815]|uniref:C2H2-type domain-containing protein n=1 Tax=Saccharomyces mikatae IFO 1815 TaxID=226126 RepID=A0AA35NGE9_SACMI|nr:uncharacterized protein SMKI_06G1110 [Saccharomyces mikatae IFO 1815]CAI4038764.1 hypothetical protein SMKI_06G1110 [Saccharomyces mikatae IFO 1815]
MAVGQKKYICSFCLKPFSRSEHKMRHERSHAGVKPFQCQICKHSFVRRDLLQRHIRTVHRTFLLSSCASMVESKAELPVTVGVGAVDSTSPKGIKLETLVNSMIKVNSGLINIHYHSNNTENMDKQQHGLFGTEFPFLRKKKSGFKQVKSHLASSISVKILQEYSLDFISSRDILTFFRMGVSHLAENKIFQDFLPDLFSSLQNNELVERFWINRPFGLIIACLGMSISLNQDSQRLWFICCTNMYTSSSRYNDECGEVVDGEFVPEKERQGIFAVILFYSLLVMLENNIPVSNSIKKFDVFTMLQDILKPFTAASSSYHYLNSRENAWFIFDLWVNILRDSNNFNNDSLLIFNWFVNQEFILSNSLKDFVYTGLPIIKTDLTLKQINVLTDSAYVYFIIKKVFPQELPPDFRVHDLLIYLNECFIMQQPIKSDTSSNSSLFANVLNARITDCKSKSHWLLWETIWFEFINNLTIRSGTTRNIWFIDNFPQVSTSCLLHHSSSFIDETLITTNLSIISMLLNLKSLDLASLNSRNIQLITDIVSFQLKLFSSELIASSDVSPSQVSQLLVNPNIDLLLYFWFDTIYIQRQNYLSPMEKEEFEKVEVFINDYIITRRKDLVTDLHSILFDFWSDSFIAYHILLHAIVSSLRDNILYPYLIYSPHLNDQTKALLSDISNWSCFALQQPFRKTSRGSLSAATNVKSLSGTSCLPLSPTFPKRDTNFNTILLPPLDIKAIEPISTSNYTYVNSVPKQREKEPPLLRTSGNNITSVQAIVIPPHLNMEPHEFSTSNENKQSKTIEILSQIK